MKGILEAAPASGARYAILIAALGACGPSSTPASTPAEPVQNEAPAETPTEDAPPADEPVQTLQIEVGGAGMIAIDIAGGGAEQKLHEIHTPRYTLELSEWPDSDVFVQTLAEHMNGRAGAEVLHEVDRGRGDYEVVLRLDGKLDGTVIRHTVLCGFEWEGDSHDWKAALAACQTVRPAE